MGRRFEWPLHQRVCTNGKTHIQRFLPSFVTKETPVKPQGDTTNHLLEYLKLKRMSNQALARMWRPRNPHKLLVGRGGCDLTTLGSIVTAC